MKSARFLPLLLLALVFGCTEPISPTEAEFDDDGTFDPIEGIAGKVEFDAGPFTVVFEGRQFSKGETKFGYTLINSGNAKAEGHLIVELPECAAEPLRWKPTKDATTYVDPVIGGPVVDWFKKLNTGASHNFRMWFAGDVPLGLVKVAVVVGSERYEETLIGPCKSEVGDLSLSGMVFTDASGDGVHGVGDAGIAGVTVELLDSGDNSVATAMTDVSGSYSFTGLASGTWKVRVPESTAAVDLNEALTGSFDPTSAPLLVVNLTTDGTGHDFGFRPKTDQVVEKMESGELTSDAIGLPYWKLEFRADSRGELSNETLQGYLDAIEELYLPMPFDFNDANEIKHAQDILADMSDDDFATMTKYLLVAELNLVTGRTFHGQEGLLETIVQWAEGVYVDNDPSTTVPSESASKIEDVKDAGRILRTFATTGGGGSNE